jgi:hypothetical protein
LTRRDSYARIVITATVFHSSHTHFNFLISIGFFIIIPIFQSLWYGHVELYDRVNNRMVDFVIS